MAKRFGRNQKRALRERIQWLENELPRVTAGFAGQPQPGDFPLGNEIIVSWCVEEESDNRMGEKRARVVVCEPSEQLMKADYAGTPFAFRGARYVCTGMDAPTYGQMITIELHLKGIR